MDDKCHSRECVAQTFAPILGWYILVRKRTLGGAIGYSSGRNNSSLKSPSVRGCHWVNNRLQERGGRTLEWTPIRALDSDIEVSEVVLVWGSRYSRCRVCHKTLRFLIAWTRTLNDVEAVCTRKHTFIIRYYGAVIRGGGRRLGQGRTHLWKCH